MFDTIEMLSASLILNAYKYIYTIRYDNLKFFFRLKFKTCFNAKQSFWELSNKI